MTASDAAALRRGGRGAGRRRREHPLPDRGVRSVAGQGAFAPQRRPRAARAARSTRDRDGFVIGEGGGALLIETEEHAVTRGATIYARTRRLGEHLGRTPRHRALPGRRGRCALHEARARARRHAALRHRLHQRARHIRRRSATKRKRLPSSAVFGGRECAPPMSSTKSATGHLMGAGGLTEVIACIMASPRRAFFRRRFTSTPPDPDCDLDYVPNAARKADISAAMSNSLGFGGQNSSLIVAKYE